MIESLHNLPNGIALATRCYKGDESYSLTNEDIVQKQTTAGAGGAAVGNNSNGNIINITSSDVNALVANQNVSESAIQGEASTAAYALDSLERSQANSNVVTIAAIDAATSAAHDAENTTLAIGTESNNLASQVAAGAGYGQQQTYSPQDVVSGVNGSSGSGSLLGINLNTWAIIATIAAGGFTAYYYFKHRNS